MGEVIGIIAGAGQFPRLVAEGARLSGLTPLICGFHGHTDPELADCTDAFCMVHLGQFGKLVAFFRSRGVRRLCFAGAINKPRALDLRPDMLAAKILFSLRHKGDDALLRAVIHTLEDEGFAVVSAANLAPCLRCPPGQLTRRRPSPEAWSDIHFGWPIAQAMGRHDIGQSMVIKQGMVVAVECLEGTDATLIRGGELGGKGCVAVKLVKPGQDERVDLPSIGLDTIRILERYNYQCLAVCAHAALFFDREAALTLADSLGIAVVALDPDGSLP